MPKRAPTILYGNCPHLNRRHSIIAVYRETRVPGDAMPHYQVADIECDFSDECRQEKCPLAENAPKHPPGIGFA